MTMSVFMQTKMGQNEIYEYLEKYPENVFSIKEVASHFQQRESTICKHLFKMRKFPNYYIGLKVFHSQKSGVSQRRIFTTVMK